MKATVMMLMMFALAGCSSTARFVKSGAEQRQPKPAESILVFYEKADVDFEYAEIGRIFVTRQSHATKHNPARDIRKIKEKAARQGADAVIVQDKRRFHASGGAAGSFAAAETKDIIEYFGIAVVKK